MNILMVVTSHSELGNTGEKTGFWLEELAAPYYVFKAAGANITIASPLGGQPPLDPKSADESFQTDDTRRFESDPEAKALLANTVKLADINLAEFDATFYPGGHGPLWDLANDENSKSLISTAVEKAQPLALVCHAPAVLCDVTTDNGDPIVKNRKLTGFSNSEEDAVGLTEVVPFLLEDRFQALGAHYSKGDDWNPYVVTDGKLVTGQNPASSAATAEALLSLL